MHIQKMLFDNQLDLTGEITKLTFKKLSQSQLFCVARTKAYQGLISSSIYQLRNFRNQFIFWKLFLGLCCSTKLLYHVICTWN